MNLTDKSPALVKIAVFLIGEKMNFFLRTHIFPNTCSLHQPNEAQWNPDPRIQITYMSAHLCLSPQHLLCREQELLWPICQVNAVLLTFLPHLLPTCPKFRILPPSSLLSDNLVPSIMLFFPRSLSLSLLIPLPDIIQCPFLFSSHWQGSQQIKI